MERYVAIDNVCAWPNLTLMPDSSIVATIFNQPTHGGWEGDVECWASEDDGRSWSLRGVPAAHEPGTNRMNVAAGLAHDGSLIVIASGWSKRNRPGEYSSPHDGEVLPAWTCRSRDGGRTWTHSETVAPPPVEPGPAAENRGRTIPFGDVVAMADGHLGVSVYGWARGGTNTAYFYRSADDGLNWEPAGAIHEGDSNETALLALPDGKLLAACRTVVDQHIQLFSSEDQGVSWRDEGPLTLGRQIPGHLLLLEDGRLLLTYGIRNRGLYAIGARLSADGGATWQAPAILADLEAAKDGGYPASVQTEDGTIVTAYYCAGLPAHTGYHMGVVRWKAEA